MRITIEENIMPNELKRGDVMRPPTHPGAVLREDVIPDIGLSIAAFARGISTSRATLHKILNEEKPITTFMALKIARFIGGSPAIWLRMQLNHDLYMVELEHAQDLDDIQACCG